MFLKHESFEMIKNEIFLRFNRHLPRLSKSHTFVKLVESRDSDKEQTVQDNYIYNKIKNV